MTDTPSDPDTSAEAVEAFIQTAMKEAVLSEGLPRNAEDTQDVYKAVDLLRALASERDALKAELQDAEDRANAFATKEMHTAAERDALRAKLKGETDE